MFNDNCNGHKGYFLWYLKTKLNLRVQRNSDHIICKIKMVLTLLEKWKHCYDSIVKASLSSAPPSTPAPPTPTALLYWMSTFLH